VGVELLLWAVRYTIATGIRSRESIAQEKIKCGSPYS
jgi:hypothetical protein